MNSDMEFFNFPTQGEIHYDTMILNLDWNSTFNADLYDSVFYSNYSKSASGKDLDSINKIVGESLKTNNSFKIRLYLPLKILESKRASYNFPNAVLMTNGFAETSIDIFDQIGQGLASRDIPAVFVPFPFHFTRSSLFHKLQKEGNSFEKIKDCFKMTDSTAERIASQSIFQAFYSMPTVFNYSIAQIFNDLDILEKQIHGRYSASESYHSTSASAILHELFSKSTKISLFGYSLGGLMSLSVGMTDNDQARKGNKIKRRYNKVILLESGASLDTVLVNKLLRRNHRLGQILADYYLRPRPRVVLEHFQSFFHSGVEKDKILEFEKYFEVEPISRKIKAIEARFEEDYILKMTKINSPSKSAISRQRNATAKRNSTQLLKNWKGLKANEKLAIYKKKFASLLEREVSVSSRIWKALLQEIYEHAEAKGQELLGDNYKAYMRVVFSNEVLYKKESLSNMSNELLILVGGADDIFPLSEIQSMSPDSGLALVQIPEINHFIKIGESKKQWKHWKDYILTGIIIQFLKTTFPDKNSSQ